MAQFVWRSPSRIPGAASEARPPDHGLESADL